MERVFKKVYIPVIAVCAAIVCVCLLLVGCSAAPELRLVPSEINMFVGDERDISLYAVFKPATTDDKSFTLKSDGECVEIDGTKIKAIKTGSCTLTASNGEHTAKLTVNVGYRAPQSLKLDYDGEVVETLDDIHPITFSAALDDYSDPNIAISWTVNGRAVGSGNEYVLEPNGVGEYVVTATAAGLTTSETVRVYRETTAVGYSDGNLSQHRSFSPVRFYAVENVDVNNPRSVYRWTVNGEMKSTATEFEFVPLALGTYKIGLFINGVARTVNGEEFASVIATGERAPNGYIEFDDADGVFVKWSDGAAARSVAIVNGNGDRTVYNSSDSRYTHLFGDGYFDASEFIAPCSGAPKTYTVTVYGDGAGEPFEFTQYPYDAEKYIEENVLCKNSFLTSEAQAAEWVRELYAVGKTKADGYLSREIVDNKDDITSAAVKAAEALGLSASASVDGNIVSVEFSPYVNAPSNIETASVRQTRVYIPHFEMNDSASLRARDYRLAIERASKSVEVNNTEQLSAAVMCGVLPVPAPNTIAAQVYTAARKVLMGTIGRNYSDAQKAHAVYDWLQYCTLRVRGDDSASISNYLEGVFGVASTQLVVSDLGAAKAFALLCGMEGMACEIVNADGDYYNIVEIDGLRYNVDVYDGELAQSSGVECCTHAGLLFADGKPNVAGACYDDSLMFYLQKNMRNGVYYDRNIDASDSEAVIKAAVLGDFESQSRMNFRFELPYGWAQQSNTDFGIEFLLDGLSDAQKSNAVTIIEKYVAEYIEEYVKKNYNGDDVQKQVDAYLRTVHVTRAGDLVLVTATIPTFVANG